MADPKPLSAEEEREYRASVAATEAMKPGRWSESSYWVHRILATLDAARAFRPEPGADLAGHHEGESDGEAICLKCGGLWPCRAARGVTVSPGLAAAREAFDRILNDEDRIGDVALVQRALAALPASPKEPTDG